VSGSEGLAIARLRPRLPGAVRSAWVPAMNGLRPATLGATLLAAGLGGCHLIDQRDFNPNAGKPPMPKVAAAPPSPGPAALLTISYANGDPAYAQGLSEAVTHALTAKPNVLFTVQTLVPLEGDANAQAGALQAAAGTAREVAEAIVTDGADQGQIELAVRADPGVKAKEVRVFVH